MALIVAHNFVIIPRKWLLSGVDDESVGVIGDNDVDRQWASGFPAYPKCTNSKCFPLPFFVVLLATKQKWYSAEHNQVERTLAKDKAQFDAISSIWRSHTKFSIHQRPTRTIPVIPSMNYSALNKFPKAEYIKWVTCVAGKRRNDERWQCDE